MQTQVTLPIAQLAAALASQQNRAATPLLQQATPQGALTQQATPLTQQATPLTPLYVLTPQQLAQLATEGSALTLEKTETAEAEPTEKVKETNGEAATNGDANEEDEKETEEKDMMLEIVVMEAEDQDQLPVHEQSHALLFGEWQANFLNQVR